MLLAPAGGSAAPVALRIPLSNDTFMPVCAECGATLASAAEPCAHCGGSAADSFTCEHCGTEAGGAAACPRCGVLRAEQPCDAHPERTTARSCVVCGRAVCDECAVSGRDPTRCAEHDGVPMIEGWAQVYTTASEIEARLVAENLESEGIDAQVYAQNDRIFPVDLGELSMVRVLVPAWEYAQALESIRGHMDVRGEVAFACRECGAPTEPGAVQCAACGAQLDAAPGDAANG